MKHPYSHRVGYRSVYHKIRQIQGLNFTRDQVYAAIAPVGPDLLDNMSIFFSVGPNWVLSMDGNDKLMGYQNAKFPLALYGCQSKIIV